MTAPLDTAGMVAQLRRAPDHTELTGSTCSVQKSLLRQAADEIERLSALESRPVALADATPKDTAKDSELAEARAALERLQEALGPFAFAADEMVRPHHEDGWCITVGIPVWVLRRARTVLSREASSNE